MSKNLSDIFPPTEIGGGGGGIEEAPKTGKLYARKDAAWQEFEAGDIEPGSKDGETLAWSTADAEWMPNDTLIVKGGNVGIGTDSPGAPLDVAGAIRCTTGFQMYDSGSIGRGIVVMSGDDPVFQTGTTAGTRSLLFKTENTERMRIDSSGNVGIGTASPSTVFGNDGLLQVYHNTTDGIISTFGSTDSSNGAKIQLFQAGTQTWNIGMDAADPDLIFEAGATEYMRIDSSGNLLVGTTSAPSSSNVKQILAKTGDCYLQIASGATGGGLLGQNGATMLFYTYTGAVGSESYTERMRIDDSGNLLVGRTDAASTNNVKGCYIDEAGAFIGQRGGAASLFLNRFTSDGDIAVFRRDGTTVGSLSAHGGAVNIGNGIASLAFLPSLNTIHPNGTGSGSDGLTSLGWSNNRFKDLYLSGTLTNNGTGGISIDTNGRVGIGGQPSRSAEEIAKEAKDTLAGWKSTFDERLKAEPKADKKAVTLEITGDEFDTFPTEETLVERLTERNIGGGTAKLQVAGDGYFNGYVSAVEGYFGPNGTGSAGVQLGGQGAEYAEIQTFENQVGYTSKPLVINRQGGNVGIGGTPGGAISGGNARLQVAGDGYFTGTVNATTINGKVTDVADHIKAITPTQIANWDAGTGGGGGGATTDGRISDTQITHWDTAYGWGNHAAAGYQPAGSYADANHTHSQYLTSSSLTGYATESWVNSQGFAKGSFVPTSGNTTISGTLTATDFVATSDERLKQNATTAPVGLVDQLRGVEFEWREDGRQDAGVIAQEVEKVLPHLVHDNGEHKAVNYNGLVAYLIEEVKSLRAEVEGLKR